MNDQSTASAAIAVTPDAIMQLGSGYWASKTLLSAVELQLFTVLARGPMTADAIRDGLGRLDGVHRTSLEPLQPDCDDLTHGARCYPIVSKHRVVRHAAGEVLSRVSLRASGESAA